MERTGMAKAIVCQSLAIVIPLVVIFFLLHRLLVAQWPASVFAPLIVFGFWGLVWFGAGLEDD